MNYRLLVAILALLFVPTFKPTNADSNEGLTRAQILLNVLRSQPFGNSTVCRLHERWYLSEELRLRVKKDINVLPTLDATEQEIDQIAAIEAARVVDSLNAVLARGGKDVFCSYPDTEQIGVWKLKDTGAIEKHMKMLVGRYPALAAAFASNDVSRQSRR
ncbi:MAG TPA: hypothetical protein VEC17_03310 [Candidatus Binatia bacterium]|nr:hypothetical protein [Candidatus Binatia bacterium]